MKGVIDGRCVLNEYDLHRRRAGAFGYGPRYTHDVEALRERLSAGDPRPVELVWIHGEAIRMAVGAAAYTELVGLLEGIEADDQERDWTDRFVFRLLE